MGVTLLSASGDDGVMGFREERPQVCGYDPLFPACSPYVTSVGATMGPQTTGNVEIACTSDQGGVITSGGGFSNVYPTPAWQQSVVTTYLETVSDQGNEPHKGYSPTGRGYPDVSLAGYAYLVAANKQLVSESGTSASTPVFAGFVSLVNAKRLAAANERPDAFTRVSIFTTLLLLHKTKFDPKCDANFNTSAAPSISPTKRPTRLPTSASPTLEPTTAVPIISLNPT
eukprot:gene30420-37632_t